MIKQLFNLITTPSDISIPIVFTLHRALVTLTAALPSIVIPSMDKYPISFLNKKRVFIASEEGLNHISHLLYKLGTPIIVEDFVTVI